MLKLYSAPRTRSIRVAWLLEELGVEYELVSENFVPTKSEFFIQNTPTGKFPTIDDDGFIMFESGAIIQYLLDKYDDVSLIPASGTHQRGEFLQWMYFADATAFSPLGILVWLTVYRDDAMSHPQLIEDARHRASAGFDLLEKHLQNREWLVDEKFTAADIMVGFTLSAAKLLGIIDDDSILDQYLTRLQSRPAFAIAYEKTGGVG